jgi:hypothetical protein
MSYFAKILDGLPEELQCMIRECLIDLQQESARNRARKDPNNFTHKIKPGVFLHDRLIRADFTRPTSMWTYHLMMYSLDSEYRSQILGLLPDGKLPECIGRKWVGRLKLIEDATIAWNYLKSQAPFRFSYIEYKYGNYKKMTRQRELGNNVLLTTLYCN